MSAISIPRIHVGRSTLPIVLFLFIVFALAQQFDFSHAGEILNSSGLSASDTAYVVQSGSVARPLAMLGLLVCATVLLRRRTISWRPFGLLGWSIILYILVAILSIAWAEDTMLVIKRVCILLSLWLAAFALAHKMTIRGLALIALAITGMTLVLSAGTEISMGTLRPFDPEWRFAGVLHPVVQGWNCGTLALCGLLILDQQKRWRIPLKCLVAISLMFLILTRSRVAFFATVISIVVYYFLWARRYRLIVVTHVLFAVLICASIYALYGDNVSPYLRTAASFGRGEQGEASIDSLDGRMPLWQQCIHYAVARPLLGYGYNGFFNSRRIAELSSTEWVPMHPHSGYLDTFLGIGAVGTLFFLLIHWSSLRMALLKAHMSAEYAFLAAFCISFCINLATESISSTPSFPTFLWMTLLARVAFVATPELQFARTSSPTGPTKDRVL